MQRCSFIAFLNKRPKYNMFDEGTYHDALPPEVEACFTAKSVISDKKQLGVYYTPEKGARILAQWAIRTHNDCVLEPSFGGCEFLKATKDRLESLGCIEPQHRLYGCDIDPNAFDYLQVLLPEADTKLHFKHTDFLAVSAKDFPKADVVIGNPPYVSRHNMTDDQRHAAWSIATSSEVIISKKASLWTYFVLHSLSFLQKGGRVAWILPGSFIYADYSKALRDKIDISFNRSLAVVLQERLFTQEGTEETSVVLLCEGYQASEVNVMQIVSATTLDQLQSIINEWAAFEIVGNTWMNRPQISMLSQDINSYYSRILSSAFAHRLSEFVSLTIGIVTGKSNFFVITPEIAKKHRLPEEILEPIISKFAHCIGAELTNNDLEQLRRENKRCLLVNTRRLSEENEAVNIYLNTLPEAERLSNKTFSKRLHWHQPDDGVRPDGFFSCMQSLGPVLVLNSSHSLCTNSVYRAIFGADASVTLKQAVVVCLQSTLSQFSAEVEGRSYGSGALKLEPSEAKQIVLLLPDEKEDIAPVFAKVDTFLREGNRDDARTVADSYLLQKGLMTVQDLSVLTAALDKLRQNRKVIRSSTVL